MSQKYKIATDNIVKVCLKVKPEDRVVIISDEAREEIGKAIAGKSKEIAPTKLLLIEEFVERPAKILPADLIHQTKDFNPTVSIYAATGQEGELQGFRHPLTNYLTQEINCRHGHMIGVNEEIMKTGMSADYKKVQKIVSKLYPVLKNCKKIKVKDKHGTNLSAIFSSKLKWIPEDGVIDKQGKWFNLPAGEIFTCPKNVEGKVVAWEVGDYFSDKYGLLDQPVEISIKKSRAVKVESKNKKLAQELWDYMNIYKNGNRVGEFAIGCLLGLDKLIGNLLQDEKFPGVHMAFGFPYGEKTGADWTSETHVDLIPLDVNIMVDDEKIMKEGKFLIDF